MTDKKKMFWNSNSTLNIPGDKSYNKGDAVDISKLASKKVEQLKKAKKLVDKIDANQAADAQKQALKGLKAKNEELQRENTKLKQAAQAAEPLEESLDDAKSEIKQLKSENAQLAKDLEAAKK